MTAKTPLAWVIVACVCAGPGLHRSSAFPQTTGSQNPPLVISSMSGRDLFEFYCASCHGRDGRGSGPVVPVLRVAPPDLTSIATRNGGTFPRARVETLVTGDRDQLTPAHGSKDMPVWGPIFKGLDPNDTMNRIRVANIVDYINAIQAR
ncbi:MAG: cytochrome c [Vicinamibacterales bacterium]